MCHLWGRQAWPCIPTRGVIPSDRKIGRDSFPHSKSCFHTSGIDCGEHLVPLSSSLNVAQSINRTNLAAVFYIPGGAGFLPSTVYDMESAACLVTYCNYSAIMVQKKYSIKARKHTKFYTEDILCTEFRIHIWQTKCIWIYLSTLIELLDKQTYTNQKTRTFIKQNEKQTKTKRPSPGDGLRSDHIPK